MPAVTCQCEITTVLDQSSAFEQVAGPSLQTVFQSHGPIPGIASCSGHQDAWSQIGQQRTLQLTGGSSVTETLIAFNPNEYLSYQVNDFTSVFRFLVKQARGEWWVHNESGSSRIVWKYTFLPKSTLAYLLLAPINRFHWRHYMRQALSRLTSKPLHEAST